MHFSHAIHLSSKTFGASYPCWMIAPVGQCGRAGQGWSSGHLFSITYATAITITPLYFFIVTSNKWFQLKNAM